jgi:DNA primase
VDFAQQLKSQINILDVVTPYVRLKKVGSRYVGLCPFHNEKTGSFNVNPSQGFFKCFGCGAGGDLIRFVEMKENLTFYEALQTLSERFGIPMPKRRDETDESVQLRKAATRAHEIALSLFRQALESAEGQHARDYLQRRGLTAAELRHFELGYAPKTSGALFRALEREGFTQKEMEASGLVLRRDDGSGWFDRFRGRLMFPIHSDSGRPVAFGGRALDPDQQPKYLNSPKTDIYDKSRILYNFHRAKETMRRKEQAVLVEGYMDVIGAWSAGVTEAVAPCGTSLTAEQSANLKRMCDTVVVNFDPDQAGATATERSLDLLLDAGLRVKVLQLPGGLDPDEFVRQHGADDYQRRITQAPSYFAWLTEVARRRFDLRSPEEKVEAVRFLVAAAAKMPGQLERTMVITEMAHSLGIDPNLALQRTRVAAAATKPSVRRPPPDPLERFPASERLLLQIFLHDAEARDALLPALLASPVFPELVSQAICQALAAWHESGAPGVAALKALAPAEFGEALERLMFEPFSADEDQRGVKQGIACIEALEREGALRTRKRLTDEISKAEREGDLNGALERMEQLRQFDRRLEPRG